MAFGPSWCDAKFSPMVSGVSPMCWRRAIKLAIGSNPRFGILRWWYNGLAARIIRRN
jgi:hypothetical protein